MAYPQITDNLNIHQSLATLPNQTDGLTDAQLKAKYDEAVNTIKTYVNSTLLPALESTTGGNSGTENLGSATITGVSGATAYAQLVDLKNQLDSVVVGTIPDKSLAPIKLDDEAYFGGQNFGTTTNVGNVYSLTTGRNLSTIPDGYPFTFVCNANSTGNASLTVDTATTGDILKANGSNVTNLKQNGVYSVVKSGTAFRLQGEGGEGTAVVSEVLTTKTFTNDTGDTLTGTMPNNAGDNVALASSVDTTTLKLRPPEGYYDGTDDNVTITDSDFVASNIKSGVNLFGTTGSLGAIKSIQSGTVSTPFNTGPGGNRTYNLTITSVDVDSSIVFIDYIPENQGNRDSQFTATITTSTNVELERNTGNNPYTGDINYTVVEFESVNSIQKGEQTVVASSTSNITISSVDTSKSLIFKSSRTGDSSLSVEYYFQVTPFAKLTTSTNLQLNNTTPKSHQTAWQVIEFK